MAQDLDFMSPRLWGQMRIGITPHPCQARILVIGLSLLWGQVLSVTSTVQFIILVTEPNQQ